MSTVSLAHPSTIAGAMLVSASGIGVDSGDVFKIKVHRWEADFSTVVAPTMGDTDTTPQFEHNGLLYSTGILQGWVLSGSVNSSKIGLENLVSYTHNPSASYTLKVFLSSANACTQTVVLERIRFAVDRQGAVIPLSFSYRMHNTTPSAIETLS